MVFVTVVAKAQNLFAFLDHSTTQPVKEISISNVNENYYTWQWLGLQFKNGTGLLVQASQEPASNSLVAGFFVSKTFGKDDKHYLEIGISSGREWNEFEIDYFATSGYLWYESHPEQVRKRGKVMIQISPYYSKSTELWFQGFALVSPIKLISIGAYYQTGGTIGPRAQVNLPGTISLWTAYNLNNTNNSPQMMTFGLQFINTWSLKKKEKSPYR